MARLTLGKTPSQLLEWFWTGKSLYEKGEKV